jgi:hypothetical protein
MKTGTMLPSAVRVLAVAAAFLGLPALAQSADPPTATPRASMAQVTDPDTVFARLDVNKDGFVDAQEATRLPGLPAIFREADANGDGKLDKTELTVALPKIK